MYLERSLYLRYTRVARGVRDNACRSGGHGSTGTGKTCQPTGTCSLATGRSAPGQLAHPVRGETRRRWRGRPSAGFPGAGTGDGQRNWQTV
jgi:hypothetical protein